ncbi:NAD-dependent epimerase/dehydratase family protein [Laspinema olomoucense]|uniref:NAD-dependent epimerase/dehydratase family protein n=1 Tax=Laspinema olomoucense TaxID=3231600 RepID=UPI0021BB23CF|nr:NAD-dependent epimerase/dehydratase family protein [Laspinema sp. D3d]MCT7974881.1 NAD-dependent epimerase/dehydratase family protein [Laspinema sp. D3d]
MTIRWITPMLGTAAASAVGDLSGINIVDVRDLVDKSGNTVEVISEKIQQGIQAITEGKPTVICCDYGMSRSNAIATGILTRLEQISFDNALHRVQEATGEAQIKLDPLNAVREALGLLRHKIDNDNSEYQSILITGGHGFIGTALRTSLSNNNEFRVIAPNREQIDISTGSTKLDLIVNEENIDCIVHLANPRIYTSNVAMGQSITMLRNVIDVCLSKNINLIYLSSWEIYSGYAGVILANESTPAHPKGPYGETKYLAEVLIDHFRLNGGLKCTILRSSPVYGIGSDKPKFIYNFLDKARKNQLIKTHRYKNGNPALDLLHIDDLVSAIIATLNSNFIGNLNLGTGIITSTFQIAEMIRDWIDSSSPIEQILINSYTASISMNFNLAQSHLDWQPVISFEKGLSQLLSDSDGGENEY